MYDISVSITERGGAPLHGYPERGGAPLQDINASITEMGGVNVYL